MSTNIPPLIPPPFFVPKKGIPLSDSDSDLETTRSYSSEPSSSRPPSSLSSSLSSSSLATRVNDLTTSDRGGLLSSTVSRTPPPEKTDEERKADIIRTCTMLKNTIDSIDFSICLPHRDHECLSVEDARPLVNGFLKLDKLNPFPKYTYIQEFYDTQVNDILIFLRDNIRQKITNSINNVIAQSIRNAVARISRVENSYKIRKLYILKDHYEKLFQSKSSSLEVLRTLVNYHRRPNSRKTTIREVHMIKNLERFFKKFPA